MPTTTDTQYPPAPPSTCQYCGGDVSRVSQEQFYGQEYDGRDLFVCQGCHARIGTHDDGTPLGTLADAELRSLRGQVHDLFDPMWQDNPTDRQEAYDFFFGQMLGLPEERRHVGMLGKDECRKAIRILKNQ
jgi:hypothetical protein